MSKENIHCGVSISTPAPAGLQATFIMMGGGGGCSNTPSNWAHIRDSEKK